jgi:microsomal epoxide hydrolase
MQLELPARLQPSFSTHARNMSFADIPSKTSLKPKPFKAHVSDEQLSDFKQLLKLSKIAPLTYENKIADPVDFNGWGLKREWMVDAKKRWETSYDWRKTEDRINSFPNFTVPIEEDGFTFDVQFLALFSKKADAVPLTLLHGWPGSILEFLGTLEVLKEKYTPDTLPFHVVVPSLPGYGYSSGRPYIERVGS